MPHDPFSESHGNWPGIESARLRDASTNDAIQLWRLANDPSVRESSFRPKAIRLDRHIQWLDDRLASGDTRIWVLEVRGRGIVAQVRYDRTTLDEAEIDFSVAPEFRGRGLGTEMLRSTQKRACEELEVMRLRGVVFQSNVRSARAFLKSGFTKVRDEWIEGHECHIFELTCSGSSEVNQE